MAKIKKLYKKTGKDTKELVYPVTITQAIKDGETGQNLHDYMNDVKPKFKFDATQTDSQDGTVGTIMISQDGGKTWNPISPEFLNNLRIQGYVATTSALPANKPVGTIYGVGPTYATEDTDQTNPIYRLYVYNGTTWVDNGQFTSIAAGIVQETGDSETEVMSQKAVTENIEQIGIKNLYQLESELEITDEYNNVILGIENGDIKTKNFDSENLHKYHNTEFAFSDEHGYVILEIENGHIKTKNFDSENLTIPDIPNIINLPKKPITIYAVCNDLNKSNKWGINTTNESVSIYLDHFFITDKEVNLKFDNGLTHINLYAEINGLENTYNKGFNINEELLSYNIEKNGIMSIKFRTILNSYSKHIKPIVLQIGDSVTEGWFANYPLIDGAPIQSYSWAKYYFMRDKNIEGEGFDCMFVGHKNKSTFDYNNITGTSFACGYSGKSPSWIYTNEESPFVSDGVFSLKNYIEKYKTLSDDGITRLEVGKTAGTEVSDINAWDLCTPNIVVIQLGLNGTSYDWQTYIPLIINSIKNEYPSMKIIISILDGCICNYPSKYPNWESIYFKDYDNAHTKMINNYIFGIDNIENEEEGIYVIYNGAVMPMPYCCNVRELNDDFNKVYVGVDAIERVKHPSRYGHKAIGYELYSIIKYVLLKN